MYMLPIIAIRKLGELAESSIQVDVSLAGSRLLRIPTGFIIPIYCH
jgi:hypothetical protein